jgi:hypothetical protein
MADIVELIYADHDWFRRQFFFLDEAKTEAELAAIWQPLAIRLETHADAEETVFYPALLNKGNAGDPRAETVDAIDDHNAIRDAIAAAGQHRIGTKPWLNAVGKARTENGEHLDEEEREALSDFIKSASLELRRELAMAWLEFYHQHPAGKGVDRTDKDAGDYIEENEAR